MSYSEENGQVVLTGPQLLALYDLKGTGRCVGSDARWKTRLMAPKDYRLSTLQALRRKGLIEHFMCCEWFLTDAGEAWVKTGRLHR